MKRREFLKAVAVVPAAAPILMSSPWPDDPDAVIELDRDGFVEAWMEAAQRLRAIEWEAVRSGIEARKSGHVTTIG